MISRPNLLVDIPLPRTSTKERELPRYAPPVPAQPREQAPTLSVIVPVYNEEGCIEALVAATCRALEGAASFELICVDDGSCDGTEHKVFKLHVEPRQTVHAK